MAQVLGVSVTFSCKGLDTPVDPPLNERQRLRLELTRNFAMIANSKHQEALTQLARALASESPAAAVFEKETDLVR